MKLEFLELPLNERRVYFEQAAANRNISAVLLEKDFWVSWLLAVLFQTEFGEALVFKGGTSLSKVFGVINRFSEDIDLSLSPDFLALPIAGESRNQSNKWMERAEAACANAIRKRLAPRLEVVVSSYLGAPHDSRLECLTDPATNSPVVLFHYPSTQPTGFEYLQRSVKLEFGSLTDQKPVGRHQVKPLLADILPDAFRDWRAEVIVLELERTFWEKATILHAEHHRPAERPTPDRFSRHYADTASLAQTPAGAAAIEQREVMEKVVAWKSQFFGSAWARYDLAKPGTFRLTPAPDRIATLSRDYEVMRSMYLSPPDSFETILNSLQKLEDQINRQR